MAVNKLMIIIWRWRHFSKNELKLTYLNFSEENTSLIVYDSSRNQLYEKDLKSNFVTQHGIDFSKAKSGNYEVVLSSGNEVYSYDVFIKGKKVA